MRKMCIFLDNFEWEISLKGHKVYDDTYMDKKRNKKHIFAKLNTKDNKILGIFDVIVNDEQLEFAKSDEIMKEVCEFSATIYLEGGKKIEKKFAGDFYDALIFIKNQQKSLLKDHLRK